jgi:hypothetical protein
MLLMAPLSAASPPLSPPPDERCLPLARSSGRRGERRELGDAEQPRIGDEP